MKLSASFKVGILSLSALLIFFCTVLWVKGRAFSSAKRIEVQFKDVNGMRPGSAVQMMGMRVGQVEEIKPVITRFNKVPNLIYTQYILFGKYFANLLYSYPSVILSHLYKHLSIFSLTILKSHHIS